jgi:hypothetical protein
MASMTSKDNNDNGRRAARKTALLLGGIALTIYALFILTGLIGR